MNWNDIKFPMIKNVFMKDLLGVMDWYDGLPDDLRMVYQNKFGKYDIPDRETRFFEWLDRVRKIIDKPPENEFEKYFDSQPAPTEIPEIHIEMIAENGEIWMRYNDGRPAKIFAKKVFDPFDGKYKYVKYNDPRFTDG